MSQKAPHVHDPNLAARIAKLTKRDRRVEHVFRRVLRMLERVIAALTVMALMATLVLEVYNMFTVSHYFDDVTHILHNLLTIVVGLEFVRMLIDTTPANILEVLTVAITRHVVLEHENPWSNLACIACIAALFAIRRFLIPSNELREEMVDIE